MGSSEGICRGGGWTHRRGEEEEEPAGARHGQGGGYHHGVFKQRKNRTCRFYLSFVAE